MYIETGRAIIGIGKKLDAFISDDGKYVLFLDIDNGKYIEVEPDLVKHVADMLNNSLSETKIDKEGNE